MHIAVQCKLTGWVAAVLQCGLPKIRGQTSSPGVMISDAANGSSGTVKGNCTGSSHAVVPVDRQYVASARDSTRTLC